MEAVPPNAHPVSVATRLSFDFLVLDALVSALCILRERMRVGRWWLLTSAIDTLNTGVRFGEGIVSLKRMIFHPDTGHQAFRYPSFDLWRVDDNVLPPGRRGDRRDTHADSDE
ncbi:hypothetical protein Efla_004512 [Eimeria flavescens]